MKFNVDFSKKQLKYALTDKKTLWIVLLIFLAAMSRIIPHAPNFTAITAIGVFAGAYFSSRLAAVWIPFAAMILSDLVLNQATGGLWVYMPLMLISLMATFFVTLQSRWDRILLTGFLSSLVFYLVSNFGVWLEGQLYPPTFQGLIDCYVMAIPFFGNQIKGDMLFVGALFGAYQALKKTVWKIDTEDADSQAEA